LIARLSSDFSPPFARRSVGDQFAIRIGPAAAHLGHLYVGQGHQPVRRRRADKNAPKLTLDEFKERLSRRLGE